MGKATNRFAVILKDVKAATAVEYGLILALVVLALVVGLAELGTGTSSLWGDLNARVQAAR